MARLTGTSLAKPRAPPVYNVWARSPDIKALVDREYKLAHPNGGVVDLHLLRSIKSRLYEEMVPNTEKTIWRKQALEEGKALVKEWEQNLVSPPATDPESRQQLVFGLYQFSSFVLTYFQLHRWDRSDCAAIFGSHLCAHWLRWIRQIWWARASGWWALECC